MNQEFYIPNIPKTDKKRVVIIGGGFAAWVLWSIIHLFTIVGVKNRLSVFLNWSWNYFTYDQSLRLLIKPKMPLIYPDKENEHICKPHESVLVSSN